MACTMIIESHDRPSLLRVFRYGFWSAALGTIASVASALALLGFFFVPGTRLDLVSDVFGFIVAALFLVLVVSIQHASTKEQRMNTHLSLIFAVISLVVVCMNYYLQLTVLRHLPVDGGVVAIFGSIFLAMVTLGYGFLGVAALLVAPVFSKDKLESAIHWLFIVIGVLGVLGIMVYPFNLDGTIVFAGLFVWNAVFPLSMLLLAVFFQRQIEEIERLEKFEKTQ